MKLSTSTVIFVAGIIAGSQFGSALVLQTRGEKGAWFSSAIFKLSSLSSSEMVHNSDVSFIAAVTATQFSNFKLFAQYAGAAYCDNNVNSTGGLITCAGNVCPTVQSNGAKSIVEFTGCVKLGSKIDAMTNHGV